MSITYYSTKQEMAHFISTLPSNITTHVEGDKTMYCVPDVGFERLIAYITPRGSWINSNHKLSGKKNA